VLVAILVEQHWWHFVDVKVMLVAMLVEQHSWHFVDVKVMLEQHYTMERYSKRSFGIDLNFQGHILC
jgi:hypothetical protein